MDDVPDKARGDDEDDELGHIGVRARSPKTRPKSTSKLGIEMMRTNSRGSVISVEDIGVPDSALPSSPPPVITEDYAAEEREGKLALPRVSPMSLTPPEIFPAAPGDNVAEFRMQTPKASIQSEVTTPIQDEATTPDPDPTPRANSGTGA